MDFTPIFDWIENLPFATAIREVGTWFPWIESIHVLFVATVVGTIWIVDFRLIGWAWTSRSIKQVTHELLPFTWIAFVGAAITGSLLFTSAAVKYSGLFPFQAKMVLLFLAFLNMMWFHFVTAKDEDSWDMASTPPNKVRFAGATSLLLWMLIIVAGRWIGFAAQL
jgi:hypothetical protein